MKKYFITQLLVCDSGADQVEAVNQLLAQEKTAANLTNTLNVMFYNQEAESLKIATIRNLLEKLAYASYQGKKSWHILLHADKATIPAQNAMLKLLEEPPAHTQIVLTVNEPAALLPTITSRCQIIHQATIMKVEPKENEQAAAVLAEISSPQFNYSRAIELAQQYKDRERAIELTQGLSRALVDQLETTADNNSKIIQLGTKIIEAKRALQQNLNPQLALEHCFFSTIKNNQKVQ